MCFPRHELEKLTNCSRYRSLPAVKRATLLIRSTSSLKKKKQTIYKFFEKGKI